MRDKAQTHHAGAMRRHAHAETIRREMMRIVAASDQIRAAVAQMMDAPDHRWTGDLGDLAGVIMETADRAQMVGRQMAAAVEHRYTR